MTITCDYLVIGGGSAGCVLARRLSDDPAKKVVLVEAGPARETLMVRMPAGFAYAISSRRFDWNYESEPEPALGGRVVPCPRGRVLGGSSAINAMAFVRGTAQDYDGWAAQIGPEWSYRKCLPYFKRIETYSGGASPYRGGDGPLYVQRPRYSSPLNDLFLSASQEAGFPGNPDPNAASLEGFGPMDQTIAQGQRASAARAYLSPVVPRPNLRILADTGATRLIVAGMKVLGAHVTGPHFSGEIHAGETISCAGAINSPKLLLLSGIGPAETLEAAGIAVAHALPGVGRNLQDHVDISVRQYSVATNSMTALLWEPKRTLTGLRWLLRRDGPCATNHFEVAGYIRTRESLPTPNIQICFIPLLVGSDGQPIGRNHGFQATVMLLHPSSRGRISLRDSDPASPPRVLFNYLSDADEAKQLVEGIRATRRIFSQPALRKISGKELEPGDQVESDPKLRDFVLRTAKSTHHPCGTCRMGPSDDPEAVVDGVGRVHGLAGLRVVDASVMPRITSGNINAPVLMIAEKIAASITGSVAG